MKQKNLFIALLFTYVCIFFDKPALSNTTESDSNWSLEDVSMLYPLPENLKDESFIHLNPLLNIGHKKLLPENILKMLPALIIPHSEEEMFESLQVVGIRIDPCFIENLNAPFRCHQQIRLVWQPIELDRRHSVIALDTAIHSFHNLKENDFKSFLLELKKINRYFKIKNTDNKKNSLDVNSDLKNSKMYRAELAKLIYNYLGLNNLIRVTSMSLRGAGDMWQFQSFQYLKDNLQPEPIPRLNNSDIQTFINTAIPATSFDGGSIDPLPTPEGKDTFNSVMMGSIELPENSEILNNELQAIINIENPNKHNPKTVDCVSCHVANSAKLWVKRNNEKLYFDMTDLYSYKSTVYNLENNSETNIHTQNLRSFGYFQNQPITSQRVINESAEVAKILNQLEDK